MSVTLARVFSTNKQFAALRLGGRSRSFIIGLVPSRIFAAHTLSMRWPRSLPSADHQDAKSQRNFFFFLLTAKRRPSTHCAAHNAGVIIPRWTSRRYYRPIGTAIAKVASWMLDVPRSQSMTVKHRSVARSILTLSRSNVMSAIQNAA